VRRPTSSAGEGARRVLGLGERSCRDGAMRVRRNAALIKRASLWPCCSLCGRGGENKSCLRRTVGSSRPRAVDLGAERVPGRMLELTPRGSRAARIFVLLFALCAGGLQRVHLWVMTYEPADCVFGGGGCAPRHGMGEWYGLTACVSARVVCLVCTRSGVAQ
jgi:hypothetical protein